MTSKKIRVELTPAQLDAVRSCIVEVMAGEGDGWSGARWRALINARDILWKAAR